MWNGAESSTSVGTHGCTAQEARLVSCGSTNRTLRPSCGTALPAATLGSSSCVVRALSARTSSSIRAQGAPSPGVYEKLSSTAQPPSVGVALVRVRVRIG